MLSALDPNFPATDFYQQRHINTRAVSSTDGYVFIPHLSRLYAPLEHQFTVRTCIIIRTRGCRPVAVHHGNHGALMISAAVPVLEH